MKNAAKRIVLLVVTVLFLVSVTSPAFASIMPAEQRELYGEGILYYDREDGSDASGGGSTGNCSMVTAKNVEDVDTSGIKNAKNASKKEVTNLTPSRKELVEEFGELSVAVGKAFDLPPELALTHGVPETNFSNGQATTADGGDAKNNFWGLNSYDTYDDYAAAFIAYGQKWYNQYYSPWGNKYHYSDDAGVAVGDIGWAWIQGPNASDKNHFYTGFTKDSIKELAAEFRELMETAGIDMTCGGIAGFPLAISKKNQLTSSMQKKGSWTESYHTAMCPNYFAVDIMTASGQENVDVLAMHDGEVINANDIGYTNGMWYGNIIVIHDENNQNWGHLHVNKVKVKQGMQVKQGDVIAQGVVNANGYHVHVDLSNGSNRPGACASCKPKTCPVAGSYDSTLGSRLWEMYQELQ